jgi:SSS family solute:Na+ symporter
MEITGIARDRRHRRDPKVRYLLLQFFRVLCSIWIGPIHPLAVDQPITAMTAIPRDDGDTLVRLRRPNNFPLMNPYLIGILAYSLLLMMIGVLMGRRVKSASDFLVAGRRLGARLVFATFLAANLGAGSTVGATGLGFRFGLSAWWWVGSASIGTLLLATLLGPKLWEIAKENGLNTMGDFLEWRYGKAVKGTIACLLWLGTLAILAGQLIAISWILNVVLGLPKWAGCAVGGIVAIVYYSAGGLMASAFVNMVELTVTMSGLLLAVPFALHAVGGWSHLVETVNAQQLSVGLTGPTDLFSMTGVGIRQILAYLAILTPSFMVSPGLVQKLYGARSKDTVQLGVGLNSLAQAGFAIVPGILGLCALAAFPRLSNAELALPTVMMKLLPKWMGVWALASIFSAELSATDAILFMLSTSLAVDLYKTFLNPQVSDKKLLLVSRVTAVVAGGAGVLIAALLSSIVAAVSIFYGLLAVSLFVPVIAGLYWKRVNSQAVLASIFSALAATLLISHYSHGRGWWILSPQAIGIVTAGVVVCAATVLKVGRRSEGKNSLTAG